MPTRRWLPRSKSRRRRPERLHRRAPEAGRPRRLRRSELPRCGCRRDGGPRGVRDRPMSADHARHERQRYPRARYRRNTSAPRRRRPAAGRARSRRSSIPGRSHRLQAGRSGGHVRWRSPAPRPQVRSPMSSRDWQGPIGRPGRQEFPPIILRWRSKPVPTAGRAQMTSPDSVLMTPSRLLAENEPVTLEGNQ